MFLIGLVLTCLGLPVSCLSILLLYIKEESSKYRVRISEEELLLAFAIGFIMLIVGIILMIFAAMKRRNQNLLDSIENKNIEKYCSDCHISITSAASHCPICGKQIK